MIDTLRQEFKVAEFFAGIGLVREGLETNNFKVVFSNDFCSKKKAMYSEVYGDTCFVLADIRDVRGADIPDVHLATASFPCTDLSLAGGRSGLAGKHSSMLWEFVRVIKEMKFRKPRMILIENVTGLVSSKGGADFNLMIKSLSSIGYICDAFIVDAKHFVPQSRPRLFIVASLDQLPRCMASRSGEVRPRYLEDALNLSGQTNRFPLPPLTTEMASVSSLLRAQGANGSGWWNDNQVSAFVGSLSPLNAGYIERKSKSTRYEFFTAYRRTRNGKAIWEVRKDGLSGCLRTASGGSSKQAVVRCGHGKIDVRWMRGMEYALLQGTKKFRLENFSESAIMLGYGDAVCVPVIDWIAKSYLEPALRHLLVERSRVA